MATDKAQVLIVDDNEGLRSSYQLAAEAAGYSTAVASNGAEAWAMLASVQPRVVLLDINMPEMDGLEFLDRLSQKKAAWQSITVIAMSADPNYSSLARQKGAYEFVEKPAHLDYLLRVIALASGGQQVAPELRSRHLADRERAFREDDLRRARILATRPLQDPAFHRMLNHLLTWLADYFDIPLTLVNLLRGDVLEVFAINPVVQGVPQGMRFACEDTYCAELIRTEEDLVLKDALLHPLYKSHAVTRLGIRFYVSVPIRVEKGLAVGTLCLESLQPAEFFTEDLTMLHFFADAIGSALFRAGEGQPSAWAFFPDPIFLPLTAFQAVLDSRVARYRRVQKTDLIGLLVDDEWEQQLASLFQQCRSRSGIALGRGRFGIAALGGRVTLQQMIRDLQKHDSRFSPHVCSLVDLPSEIVAREQDRGCRRGG